MTIDSAFHGLSLIFQVFLLDLILSGDNAVVIALSCRSLPPRQLNQALLIGTGAAIALRIVLTTVVSMLMKIPMLKLIGAALLIVIGIRLLIMEERGTRPVRQEASSGLWSAITTVIVADVVMSLDNVVALSAVTQGNILYLAAGLVLSVLLLMFSSRLMMTLLRRYPILVPAAGALLGYIAGNIAVSDPAVADWVNTQSPALTGLVPVLCAVLVVAESRIIQRRREQLIRPAAPAVPARASALATAARPAPIAIAKAPPVPPIPVPPAPAVSSPPQSSPDDPPPPAPPPPRPLTVGKPPGDLPPANRFGIARLIGNPFVQLGMSVVLALCCIVLLPRIFNIVILIGLVALMLLKIF